MSSSSSVTTTNPLALFARDPMYGSVYDILQRPYIGSWGDANVEYARIRQPNAWKELRELLAAKPTQDSQAKAAELVKEINSLSADLGDTSAKSATSGLAAETVVKLWMPPVKAAVPKSSGPKPSASKAGAKKVMNTFAALAESDDEDGDE